MQERADGDGGEGVGDTHCRERELELHVRGGRAHDADRVVKVGGWTGGVYIAEAHRIVRTNR